MKCAVSVIVVSAALLLIAADERDPEAGPDARPDGYTTEQWIDRLRDDRYTVRQQATDALIGMGKQAVPILMEAAVNQDTEVRARAFRGLATLAHSANAANAQAALSALETLANSENRTTAAAAIDTLRWHHFAAQAREQKAVAALARLHAILEPDQFGRVKSCNLSLFPIPDGGLAPLKEFARLQVLDLSGTRIGSSQLVHLRELRSLSELKLIHTPVSDAGLVHLKGLTNLETLDLFATEVTDAGLEHLRGLTKLRTLRLNATAVTDEGVKSLRKALPHTTIYR